MDSGPFVEDQQGGVNQRSQDRAHWQLQDPRRRYRIPRSSGRDSQRAHQLPDRTFQGARQRSSFAARPPDAGRTPPPAAGLPENQGRTALRGPDQATQYSQIDGFRRFNAEPLEELISL